MTTEWHESHDERIGLAEWIDSECCIFAEPSDVIRFFAKPWHWTREYHLWQLWNSLAKGTLNDERRQECIDAVFDDKLTAEYLKDEWEEADAN